MGINQGTSIFWRTVTLTFDQALVAIKYCRDHHPQNGSTSSVVEKNKPMVVALDANLLGYKFLGNRSSLEPAEGVFQIAKAFSAQHFKVIVVADNSSERHPSKRATCQRTANRKKARVLLTAQRSELQSLLMEQSTAPNPAEHNTKVSKCQQKVVKLENELARQFPHDFAAQLGDLIGAYDPLGKGDIEFMVAPTQADPCVAKLVVDGTACAIASDDGDFHMYVGTSGCDLMIKEISIIQNSDRIQSCRLGTGQEVVADMLDTVLSDKLGYGVFTKKAKQVKKYGGNIPKYPIFNRVSHPMIRALLGMWVGCDACPQGVVGSGPQKAFNWLEKQQKEDGNGDRAGLADSLATKIAGMSGARIKDATTLKCLCQSMIYEKTGPGDHDYIFGEPPMALDTFNKEFRSTTTAIKDDLTILTCKGSKTDAHFFLAGEGHSACANPKCGSCLCRFCQMNENELPMGNDRIICLDCANDFLSGTLANEKKSVSEAEMRKVLALKGVALPQKATYIEVLQLYERQEEGAYDLFEPQIQGVQYPILPAKALLPSSDNFEILKPATPVANLTDIILDTTVDLQDIVAAVNIFTSLAYIKPRPQRVKMSYEYVVPKLVVDLANNSRIHEGHRLCDRAVRHAEDSGNPDILSGNLVLARHDGEVCFILKSKVLASMRAMEYNGATAFGKCRLIATTCKCTAGADNEQIGGERGDKRVTCTHSIARLVQFSHLFYREDGQMVKSILGALHSRLRKEGEREWMQGLPKSSSDNLFNNVTTLIRITGCQPPVGNSIRSAMDLLANYSVSTDSAKLAPEPPCVRDLGLLRDKMEDFSTPLIAAEKRIKQEQVARASTKSNHEEAIKNIPKGTATMDEYVRNQVAVEALAVVIHKKYPELFPSAGKSKRKKKKPIGLLINKFRAEKSECCDDDRGTWHMMVTDATKEWEECISQLGVRKRVSLKKLSAKRKRQEEFDRLVARNLQKSLDRGSRRQSLRTSPESSTKTATKKIRLAEKEKISSSSNKRKRNGPKKYCCYPGCDGNNLNAKLTRIPPFPGEIKEPATEEQRKKHRIAQFVRREWMERLRIGRFGKGQKVVRQTGRGFRKQQKPIEEQDLRWCKTHKTELVTSKTVTYRVTDAGGTMKEKHTTILPFEAPISSGMMKSPPTTTSNGLGNDRELFQHVLRESLNDSKLTASARHAVAREINSANGNSQNIASASRSTVSNTENKVESSAISFGEMTPEEVKQRTGFASIVDLLQYTAIVYGGDLKGMAQTTTKLDWFEELLLFYEFTYHHSGTRTKDYAKSYKIHKQTAESAIKYRMEKELRCRERWPMYCSLEEDMKFRQEKWKHVGKRRVVFHDTTNKPMPKPSKGDLQRALYNQYYAMCCAKAGVAAQLCNWVFGLPLVTGHSDDDQQIEQTRILEYQKEFAESDLSMGELIAFLNVFDKGYNRHLHAKKLGQECVTPTASCYVKTNADAVLRSAGIAVFRSGNERAVRRAKLSLFIANETHHSWDVDFVCDVWEAWTFRINFMYQDFQ